MQEESILTVDDLVVSFSMYKGFFHKEDSEKT